MLSLLHTADWQIGRQYARFAAEDAAMLADARFTTIERIADLATKEQVDAVLVAGDVFDSQTVSDRTIHRTFDAMKAYTGLWVMLPGNHDAALAESVWRRALRIGAVPDNVRLLLTPQAYLFEEMGFAILAAPLTQRQTYHDLTLPFDTTDTPKHLFRIGLAHGSVTGLLPESVDSPNPIHPQRAASAQLDYLALGDWHGKKEINARTWYSGTPEPDRFKNNDAGYVLKVEFKDRTHTPIITPFKVAQHLWTQINETLTVASDIEQLQKRLESLPDRSVISITLRGQIDLKSHQALQSVLSASDGRHRSQQVCQQALRLLPTQEDLATLRADGYVGEVIETLKARQQQPDGEIAAEALVILAATLGNLQVEGYS